MALTQESIVGTGIDAEGERIVPLRHPWRVVGIAAILLAVAMLVHAAVTESGFQWGVVGQYLFARPILDGVVTTIELTGSAMGLGIGLGLVLSVMRMSESAAISYVARTYISVFRAIPALVQMVFWFNLAAVLPHLSLGVPFGPGLFHFSATSVFSPFLAATLGLGLAEAAFMAEIFRGGILSVHEGQLQAARASGMRRMAALRHVVLPQAMKSVIPPTGNEVIGMLKYTSLASVISVTELLESVTLIYDRTFQTMPLLMVAALWYLAMTTVLTVGQRRIERHFGRGSAPSSMSLASQVWANARTFRHYRPTAQQGRPG